MLKSAIKTAKVGSLLTKSPTLLKSAIKTAKVGSLSDGNFVPSKLPRLAVCEPPIKFGCVLAEKCHQNCQGLQFVDQLAQGAEKCHQNCQGLAVCLRGHKTAIVWQFVSTKKSVVKTAKVWQFRWYFLKRLYNGRNLPV